jgi:hypothetical protein
METPGGPIKRPVSAGASAPSESTRAAKLWITPGACGPACRVPPVEPPRHVTIILFKEDPFCDEHGEYRLTQEEAARQAANVRQEERVPVPRLFQLGTGTGCNGRFATPPRIILTSPSRCR